VAAPVLVRSPRLAESDLVTNASTMGQGHLYAIAQRASLTAAVTDVLVERGDRRVVRSVAQNVGARFSDSGFGKLVARARDDDTLARHVGMRPDIPRHHFIKLLETASAAVRVKLAAANPGALGAVQDAVADVAESISREVRDASRDHARAKAGAKRRYTTGQLSESNIHAAARAENFEQTLVALSLLGHFPVDLVERALLDDGPDMVLILARAARCSWATAKALLLMQVANRHLSVGDLDRACAGFERLQSDTAMRVVEFYQARRKARNADTPRRRAVEPTGPALAGVAR
jgi:uncharacterized protein (DUF2336 family)